MTTDKALTDINNVLKPWGLEAAEMFDQYLGCHVAIRKIANVRRNIGKTPALCLAELLNAQT